MNEVVWHTGKPPRPKAGGCQYLCTVDFAGGLRQVMALRWAWRKEGHKFRGCWYSGLHGFDFFVVAWAELPVPYGVSEEATIHG